MKVSQKYSPSEVSLHSSNKDCWLIIHGKVYDVTTFLEDHPGGDDVLLHASASGDATQSFEEVGHSSTATSMMEGYLIGILEGHEASGAAIGGGSNAKERVEAGSVGDKPLLRLEKKKATSSSSGVFELLLPVLVLGLAFGAWYYLTYFQAKA